MPFGLVELYTRLPVLMLIVARVAGLALGAPFFSGTVIPARIRALLVLGISMVVFPLVAPQVAGPVTMSTAVVGMIGELGFGLLLGIGASAVLMGVQLGVQLVSQQAGIALGAIFNPMHDESLPVVSELYYYVAIVIFLLIGGHHALVRALLDSFSVIPPLGFALNEDMVVLFVDALQLAFVVAIRVGGPTILALLLGFLTLGFLSRTLPQLNLLTIGFPIKAAMALLVLGLTMVTLEPVLVEALSDAVNHMRAGVGMGER